MVITHSGYSTTLFLFLPPLSFPFPHYKSLSHIPIFLLFCNPPNLNKSFCVAMGLEVSIGDWWTQQ